MNSDIRNDRLTRFDCECVLQIPMIQVLKMVSIFIVIVSAANSGGSTSTDLLRKFVLSLHHVQNSVRSCRGYVEGTVPRVTLQIVVRSWWLIRRDIFVATINVKFIRS